MDDTPHREPPPGSDGESRSKFVETGGDGTVAFDCTFCEETLETPSLSEMKDRGRTHLANHHYTAIEGVFEETRDGGECHGGCGTELSAGAGDGSGFDCPTCGHDHFPEFAERYIWWRVEIE